jgi:hypothetical protein
VSNIVCFYSSSSRSSHKSFVSGIKTTLQWESSEITLGCWGISHCISGIYTSNGRFIMYLTAIIVYFWIMLIFVNWCPMRIYTVELRTSLLNSRWKSLKILNSDYVLLGVFCKSLI